MRACEYPPASCTGNLTGDPLAFSDPLTGASGSASLSGGFLNSVAAIDGSALGNPFLEAQAGADIFGQSLSAVSSVMLPFTMNLAIPDFSARPGLSATASGLVEDEVDQQSRQVIYWLAVSLIGENAAFTVNGGAMSLVAGAGSNGSIDLMSSGLPAGTARLIHFSFAAASPVSNPIVDESSNSLGLALPSVGSAPDFSVGTPSFTLTIPTFDLDPNNPIHTELDSGVDVRLLAPEPSSAVLTLLGLAGIFGTLAARGKKRVRTGR